MRTMELIIQLIAGAVGGNAIGAAGKSMSLGTAGNTVVGALGGLGGSQLLGVSIVRDKGQISAQIPV